MLKRIQNLRKARAVLTKRIIAEGKKTWPVGSIVHFEKWGGIIDAEILDVSDFNEVLLVRNNRTGREYRIDYYDLCG
jgi:hypothetical protein